VVQVVIRAGRSILNQFGQLTGLVQLRPRDCSGFFWLSPFKKSAARFQAAAWVQTRLSLNHQSPQVPALSSEVIVSGTSKSLQPRKITLTLGRLFPMLKPSGRLMRNSMTLPAGKRIPGITGCTSACASKKLNGSITPRWLAGARISISIPICIAIGATICKPCMKNSASAWITIVRFLLRYLRFVKEAAEIYEYGILSSILSKITAGPQRRHGRVVPLLAGGNS